MTDFSETLSDLAKGLQEAPPNPPSMPVPESGMGRTLADLRGEGKLTTPEPEPSIGRTLASGVVSGAGAKTLGLPVDLPVGLINTLGGWARSQPHEWASLMGSESNDQYTKAMKDIIAHPLINPSSVPGGSAWWERRAEDVGLPTVSTVHPSTTVGKVAQKAAEVGSAWAVPGAIAKVPRLEAAGAIMPGSPVANLAIGAGSGAAGELAAEAGGEEYRPLGEMGAGVAGATGASLTGKMAGMVPPIRAATREAAAQEAATQRLGNVSADPDVAAAQLRQQLAGGRQEPIPGSLATTAELANDPGLLGAQRVRERESPYLRQEVPERRAASNEARFQALESAASPSVGPETTQSYLRQLLQRSDQLADIETAHATGRLQSALSQFGGEEAVGSPEERAAAPSTYGEKMREPLQASYDAERQRLKELRKAIDPSGTMGMNPASIGNAVANIRGNFDSDIFSDMENKFYNRVDKWNDLIPIEDAFRLRADVNGRLQKVLDHNPQEQLRLLTLKGGIDKSIEDTANGAYQAERSTLSPGELSPIAQRIAAVGGDHLGPSFITDVAKAYQANPDVLRAAARDPFSRAILDQRSQILGAKGAESGAAGVREAGSHEERSTGVAGSEELPPGAGERTGSPAALAVPAAGIGEGESTTRTQTPLTPEARERFANWNRQYGEMARLYRGETPGQLHAVGNILQKGGAYDSYKLRDDQVPWLFVDGKDAPAAVDRFLAASPPEAHSALDDAFAFSLRRAAQDGNIFNLNNYKKWLNSHQDALTRRPELLEKFDTAAKAQQSLSNINDSLAQFRSDYPIKPGLGNADILRQSWKPGPQGGELMNRYKTISGGGADALEAASDYAAYDFANRPGIIKNGSIDPTAAAAWIKQHQSALAEIPGLQDRFADAATAARTLEQTVAAHQELRNGFAKSIAGAFIQDDPARAIDRVFSGSDRVRNAKVLMDRTAADQNAQEGLRRATIDYMRRRFEGAPMPGGETGSLMSKRFGDFVKGNRDVLDVLFPGRSQLFDAIAEDAKRGTLVAQAKAPGGSDTAEMLTHMRHPEGTTTGPLVAAYAAERLAEHGSELLSHIPMIRWIAGPATYVASRGIQAAGERLRLRADRIFDEMLLDPKLGADALDAYRKAQSAKAAARSPFWGRLVGQTIQASRDAGG